MIDVTQAFKLKAEDFSQELGRRIPALLQNLETELEKRGLKWPAGIVKAFKSLLEKIPGSIIEIAAGIFQVDRSIFPDGAIGDEMCNYANDMLDEVGRGLKEALAKKAAAAKSDEKPPVGDEQSQRKGYVVNGIWYPANCTHVQRPRFGKGEKGPDDITLEDALKRGHNVCRNGCLDPATEIAATVATSVRKGEPKAEAKAETPAPKPSGPSLYAHLRRSHQEEPTQFQKIVVGDGFVPGPYRIMTDEDHGLKMKFYEAFHGRDNYEDFRYVLRQPCAEWHDWLDDYLGKTEPSKSMLERELKETEEMIDSLFEQIDKAGDWIGGLAARVRRDAKIRKDRTAARKAQQADNARRASSRNRIVFFGLAAIVAVCWMLHSYNLLPH